MASLRLVAFAVLIAISGAAHAVQPDEVLADPALETRARAISAELRCLVCQNQSIDDSDAPLARDLRILVRQRLAIGASDDDVRSFVVARYGEFVLLRPVFNARNALLWLAPGLIGAGAIYGVWRLARRRRVEEPAPLSAEEQDALRRLTGDVTGDRTA